MNDPRIHLDFVNGHLFYWRSTLDRIMERCASRGISPEMALMIFGPEIGDDLDHDLLAAMFVLAMWKLPPEDGGR